jgi:hypothetical protein
MLWVTPEAEKTNNGTSLPSFCSSFIFVSVVLTQVASLRKEIGEGNGVGEVKETSTMVKTERKVPKLNTSILYEIQLLAGLPIYVTGGQMRGLPQLPSFHSKSQVLFMFTDMKSILRCLTTTSLTR